MTRDREGVEITLGQKAGVALPPGLDMHPRQIAGVAGSGGTDGVGELVLHFLKVGSRTVKVKG